MRKSKVNNICNHLIAYFERPRQDSLCASPDSALSKTGFPTFEGFCSEIGISLATLNEWRGKDSDIENTCQRCQDIQKALLVEGGLSGKYNAAFSRYLMESLGGFYGGSSTVNFDWLFKAYSELEEESR